MRWFDNNPNPVVSGNGPMAAFSNAISEERWAAHQWARQFHTKYFSPASNMARGGAASSLFAPTAGEAFKNAFRIKHREGSAAHIRNLEILLSKHPNNANLKQAVKSAQATAIGRKSVGGAIKGMSGYAIGGLIGAGFILTPAFTTKGDIYAKGRAMGRGAASMAGWEGGSRLGMGSLAALGSMLGPVGTVVGGALGFIAGGIGGSVAAEELYDATLGITDKLAEREQKRRNLNWVGDQKAFQTRKAYTMRQQSLQAMNRGMMSARSAMGREAIMLHQ